MGLLPWFHMPAGYHFGCHAFVACGYDGDKRVLASDMDAKMAGLKKGFYAPISLEQLSKARSSLFKPFPPKNLRFEFDFAGFRAPSTDEIVSSIEQACAAHLEPPIKNLGVEGMRHAARQLLKWPDIFKEIELRMNLFNLYIFIEIGGTGGGCFRFMYSRYLREAAKISKIPAMAKAARLFDQSGSKFSAVGLMFRDAEKMSGVQKKILAASEEFRQIAAIEEEAWQYLRKSI